MKEYKFIITIIIVVIIGMIAVNFCNRLVEKTRMETIESAILVESNDQGYILSFDGQEFAYDFN